jgi:hypothetical protein
MPGLIDYQRTLAAAIRQPDRSGDRPAMSWDVSQPGLALTARIRTSWCVGRSHRAAHLTLSALAEAERRSMVDAWVARGGGISSFFEAEAEAFLAFIADRVEAPSHAASLCRFERALIRASAGHPAEEASEPFSGMTMLCRSPHADLVELRAPIDDLLAAVEGERPWPPVGEVAHWLLVAPGVAGRARHATAGEIALWQAAEAPLPAARHWAAAQTMVACDALQIVPKAEI